MNPKRSPYHNGFNSRELENAFRNGQVHIVAPAVCGKSNYPVALSLCDRNNPVQTEARKRGVEIANLANSQCQCRSLLPDLPVTAMPVHETWSEHTREYFEEAPAKEIRRHLIRLHLLQVFEIHLAWMRELWINQHRMVVPSILFAFDQPQAFDIATTLDVLRDLCKNRGFDELAGPCQLASQIDIYYSGPID